VSNFYLSLVCVDGCLGVFVWCARVRECMVLDENKKVGQLDRREHTIEVLKPKCWMKVVVVMCWMENNS